MNPHTRIVVVASLVAAVALLSISVGHGAAVKPATHTVTIEAVQFQPERYRSQAWRFHRVD